MKVHTLDIDSSERDANVYPYSNNYVITLENPIYDVTKISLVSARIPTPQLTICSTNNTFSVDGVNVTLQANNYSNATVFAEVLQNTLAPPTSNIDSVQYFENGGYLQFSNVNVSNSFTLEFYNGTNGYTETVNQTTPHQVMGLSALNHASNAQYQITSGPIDFNGPNSLVIRLSSGSDEFTKTIYSKTPFFSGHILLDGSDMINYHGTDDPFIHTFHSGPQKFIKDLRVEFFYMSHGRLIPYDFRSRDHILKFEITCSTDKLEGLPKVPLEIVEDEEKPVVNIQDIVEDIYNWKMEYISIGVIVCIGLLLMFLVRRRPKLSE
jgi:hypothetical protein